MYCIISLPRTSSTYTWHLINQSLLMKDVSYVKGESTSAFNPRYNDEQQIEEKYERIMNTSPLPLIKIISSHDFVMVERIIQSPYKTVFIYPEDLRKQVLKVIVAKKTDSFIDKELRRPYIGKLVITKEEIFERLQQYSEHMKFAHRCDYSFSDRYILNNPSDVLTSMGLEYMGTRYKYQPFDISDEDMLQDVNHFNKLYDFVFNFFFSTNSAKTV
jgi:hypothetical protein